MIKFVQAICSSLENGETTAMGTILTNVGSTPRTAGTRMLIRADGSLVGTIGGGLVEAEVQNAGIEAIRTERGRIIDFDLTGADVDRMDLICGGKLTVLMECLQPSPANREFFQALLTALKDRRKSYLVTVLGPTDDDAGPMRRYLMRADGTDSDHSSRPAHWTATISDALGRRRHPVMLTIDGQRVLAEQVYVPGTVYLFGAGHVSQQVAPLAERVGFRTVVLDDRSEFANRERFPSADEVRVVSSFHGCLEDLDIDRDSYLVIVTRGHSHDKTVLEQALRSDAGYVGMIGSRRKKAALFQALLNQGFTDRDLARVYSPIGLSIGAETPEEIGISIIAELVKARSKQAPQ
ncbi:MAG: XdhC family protein [Desulfomonilaceae bacterium]|nr:XdhC family protein [Desulfomonilaceae bacterium]